MNPILHYSESTRSAQISQEGFTEGIKETYEKFISVFKKDPENEKKELKKEIDRIKKLDGLLKMLKSKVSQSNFKLDQEVKITGLLAQFNQTRDVDTFIKSLESDNEQTEDKIEQSLSRVSKILNWFKNSSSKPSVSQVELNRLAVDKNEGETKNVKIDKKQLLKLIDVAINRNQFFLRVAETDKLRVLSNKHKAVATEDLGTDSLEDILNELITVTFGLIRHMFDTLIVLIRLIFWVLKSAGALIVMGITFIADAIEGLHSAVV